MPPSLLPTLRNLRVSLITGGLIIGSLYVLFGQPTFKNITVRKEALEIIHIAPFMPQILVAMLCLLVGSLYMTALEGVVDWIHRKTLFLAVSEYESYIKRQLLLAVAPLSDSARRRIEVKADRYFDDYKTRISSAETEVQVAKTNFKRSVLKDLLWLEGKLVGTPLEVPYDQYRAEGELRLGTALVIPLASTALAYSIHMSLFGGIATTLLATVLAAKLAHYGLYYSRRAHSFLAHHVSDGTVLTPSMEHLKSEYNSEDLLNQQLCDFPISDNHYKQPIIHYK